MSERKPKSARAKSSKREAARVFQLDKFWLAEENGVWYRHWYESGSGKTRRRSTGCRDLEEAKLALAKLVLTEPPDKPLSAEQVTITSVKQFYFRHHADKIRSKEGAERAFSLLSDHMKTLDIEGAPKVADFGLARQHAFMNWLRTKHGHSCKTISTYLDYIKAGMTFAAKPIIIVDHTGTEREVKLLEVPPAIVSGEVSVSKVTGAPRSQPRSWIPEDAELARLFDNIGHEHVFRYCIIALNTWARPEAILELEVSKQVDFERGLVHLNPIGRPQNKKIRPTIRLTNNLRAWLKHWNLDRPICRKNGSPVDFVGNRTLASAGTKAKMSGKMTRYAFRHYMATRVRRVEGILVSREERAAWMGHVDPDFRTTEHWYESLDPDYLLAPMKATDAIMTKIDTLAKRSLVAPNVHASGLMVVSNHPEPDRKADAS